ncbi:hypothetical protein PoB_003967500 [Plakobranchus ocellatus]|uniref:Uncharacterized protein n=1 Tax=Plakobranchus ocellatus TaxID=259542 RepID=A0AAV4B261_9GAST|nr:hypothetical protein PoB_003967500 [Plakobranchus ocellatus]
MRCMHLRKLHSYKIALVTFMRMFQISSDSVYRCDIRDKGSVQNEVRTFLDRQAAKSERQNDRRCILVHGLPLTIPVVMDIPPEQGDLRLSGPPSGQDDDDGARTRNRRVPADLRADSLTTEPLTPKLFGPRQIRTRAK